MWSTLSSVFAVRAYVPFRRRCCNFAQSCGYDVEVAAVGLLSEQENSRWGVAVSPGVEGLCKLFYTWSRGRVSVGGHGTLPVGGVCGGRDVLSSRCVLCRLFGAMAEKRA